MGEGTGHGKGGAQSVVAGPVSDLSAVHFVAEATVEFAGGEEGEGVGLHAGRRNQGAAQEGWLFERPLALVVATGSAGEPRGRCPGRTRGEVGTP